MSSRTFASKKIDELLLKDMLYLLFTDRRPNPNTAQSGSLTWGLSFPSLRYRSGWNSWGLLKTLRSCNIDLNNIFRTENVIKWSKHQPCITHHNCPFRNIEAIIFIIVRRHVGNTFETRQNNSNDDDNRRPTKRYYSQTSLNPYLSVEAIGYGL